MFDSVSMYACLEIETINMNSHGLCVLLCFSLRFVWGEGGDQGLEAEEEGIMTCSLLFSILEILLTEAIF